MIVEDDDVWVMTLTMGEFIDGVVAAYKEELAAAGWAKASPETPVPKGEWLSAHDEVSEEEVKAVLDKGYKAVWGSLIWPSRFAHKEISAGISVACRVMSKPSKKAWGHCMQMVAWQRDHKDRGMRFRSDADHHGLVASCDAANKTDPKDSKCQHVVQFKGGTISMLSSKLTHCGLAVDMDFLPMNTWRFDGVQLRFGSSEICLMNFACIISLRTQPKSMLIAT